MKKVTPWKRFVNWGIHFACWIVIGAIVWPLELWKYITTCACLMLLASAAHWRGVNNEENR